MSNRVIHGILQPGPMVDGVPFRWSHVEPNNRAQLDHAKNGERVRVVLVDNPKPKPTHRSPRPCGPHWILR